MLILYKLSLHGKKGWIIISIEISLGDGIPPTQTVHIGLMMPT